jgi:hypothetical protein
MAAVAPARWAQQFPFSQIQALRGKSGCLCGAPGAQMLCPVFQRSACAGPHMLVMTPHRTDKTALLASACLPAQKMAAFTW